MKVGILGGSFNPAHLGHIHLSEIAIKKLALNQLWWIPTSQNPLKAKNDFLSFEERIKNCQILTKKNPKIYVKKIDNFYTIDLINYLQNKHKNYEFIGQGYCPIVKGSKYCNLQCDEGKKYCYYHSKYENSLECNYIYERGIKKGEMCKKLTEENNSKCKLHNKCTSINDNKKCIAVLKKGKNLGNICGKKIVNETDYCKSHSTLVNEQNITIL